MVLSLTDVEREGEREREGDRDGRKRGAERERGNVRKGGRERYNKLATFKALLGYYLSIHFLFLRL